MTVVESVRTPSAGAASRPGRCPHVTALTATAVRLLRTSLHLPRRPTVCPLIGVVDEIANDCRWIDLPYLYGHGGSRSPVLITILRSWSRGVECWGDRGMEAAAPGDALEEAVAEQPQLCFKTMPDFVDQFLVKSHRRPIPPNTAPVGAAAARSWLGARSLQSPHGRSERS